MNPYEVMRLVFDGEEPPYVPWAIGLTHQARNKVRATLGIDDLGPVLQSHLHHVPMKPGSFTDLGEGRVRDRFGVVWNRSVDEDIGVIEGQVVDPERIGDYTFPPVEEFCDEEVLKTWCRKHPEVWKRYDIGFSLYERAWTLLGMEELLCLMLEEPEQVHELLDRICEHNCQQIAMALRGGVDAVYFGDDWGDQRGLQMGKASWDTFIKPRLARMYGMVKDAGKAVMIHSCGKVDECFGDLRELGLDIFNPFQPEVMDVDALLTTWRPRGLGFHGGLSTQRTLPFGSAEEVRAESEHLIQRGMEGRYIFSPAHAIEGDVPVENIIACLATVQEQAGYHGPKPLRQLVG